MFALGLIETVGYTTAISAADAAVKAADVEIIGMEKVIGVGGYVGVTIHLSGDVAAVKSAVDAGRKQGELIGKIISTDVIPRAHSEVSQKLLSKFLIRESTEKKSQDEARPPAELKKKISKSAGSSKSRKVQSKDKDTVSEADTKGEARKGDGDKKA
ncbi:hypothetical protein J6TS1_47100 [Siminovitchia terrae]|uniref:BMC domain-containing protein n=1 Tax=Siminovitchia terrae TaxID=1914933 RepID=A0A429X176_SIMTE|nr:BMC domain-containing protein [Siminovitchia terrae]RST57133.1 BMC domain-containing protein [Siminovitchia terrae]GIN93105.1 hypothetical protein J22TS1_41560 [Siminovitchia terrae]GIN98840.1 hypothetical protein J6TS1_47100 [Siminovitchia terrae]